MKKNHQNISAQAAVEYMLLLGVVAAIVLIGLRVQLTKSGTYSNQYFSSVATGIMGKPNPCGDGHCEPGFENQNTCCADCFGCGN